MKSWRCESRISFCSHTKSDIHWKCAQNQHALQYPIHKRNEDESTSFYCMWLTTSDSMSLYAICTVQTTRPGPLYHSIHATIHALIENESKKKRKIKFVFSEYFQIHGLEWLLRLFALKWFLDSYHKAPLFTLY